MDYSEGLQHYRWQEKLGKKTVARIGLVRSVSTIHTNDHNRSLLLQELASLLEFPVDFHSLQKEIRVSDVKTLTDFTHIHQHQDDLLDFTHTAALVDAMDIIISVDTSVAHLAGAMGKTVCILLPYAPDYRWMLDRPGSPWYPSATLFRQPTMDDWECVIAVIREIVIKLAREFTSEFSFSIYWIFGVYFRFIYLVTFQYISLPKYIKQ